MTARMYDFPPGGRDGPRQPQQVSVEDVLTAALRMVRLGRFPATACMLILTDDTGENRILLNTNLSKLEMIGICHSTAGLIDRDDAMDLNQPGG